MDYYIALIGVFVNTFCFVFLLTLVNKLLLKMLQRF